MKRDVCAKVYSVDSLSYFSKLEDIYGIRKHCSAKDIFQIFLFFLKYVGLGGVDPNGSHARKLHGNHTCIKRVMLTKEPRELISLLKFSL